MQISTHSIIVPKRRQRQSYVDFEETILDRVGTVSDLKALAEFDPRIVKLLQMMDSITEHGQLQPISVDSDNVLINGERRLRAFQLLEKLVNPDYQMIDTVTLTVIDEYDRHGKELHENIIRDDLTKAERALAIDEYHRLEQVREGKAVPGVGGGHSVKDTAEDLDLAVGTVVEMRKVANILKVAPHLKDENSYRAMVSIFRQETVQAIRQEQARRKELKHRRNIFDSKFFLMDAEAFLNGLSPESVDFILTDGPYGQNVFESGGFREEASITATWDDSPKTVRATYTRVIPAMARVLKDGHHIFIMCGWEMAPFLRTLAEAVGLKCDGALWVWDKHTPVASRIPQYSPNIQTEFFVHFFKGVPVFPSALGNSIISCARLQKQYYPPQKPAELARILIDRFTLPGEFVVDPFCGSGVFVIESLAMGRESRGSDMCKEAIQIANATLEDTDEFAEEDYGSDDDTV